MLNVVKKVVLTGSIALSFALVGCGNVCDDAADIISDCVESSGGSAEATDAECSGEAEKVAQCTVDHESAACDFFTDPVANADNVYTQCISE